MKTILAVLALCAFAPGALAAAPECRVIENTMARLSCYDATYPPKIEKPVALEKGSSRAAYKDPFIAEDAKNQCQAKEYLPRLLSDKAGQFRFWRANVRDWRRDSRAC